MKHHVGMWTIVYIELFTKLYNCSLKNSQWILENLGLFSMISQFMVCTHV
jgi:hypothetical protein